MLKTLMKSIGEHRKATILTPVLVIGEVIVECLIPFVISRLVDEIQAGCELSVIMRYGGLLIVMAGLALLLGWAAGTTCAAFKCRMTELIIEFFLLRVTEHIICFCDFLKLFFSIRISRV